VVQVAAHSFPDSVPAACADLPLPFAIRIASLAATFAMNEARDHRFTCSKDTRTSVIDQILAHLRARAAPAAHAGARSPPSTRGCSACAAVPPRRHRTGIVVGVEDEERVHERDVHLCVTVEGNTNNDGSSNGNTTLRKVRTFRESDGHKFIRWVEMERRAVAA